VQIELTTLWFPPGGTDGASNREIHWLGGGRRGGPTQVDRVSSSSYRIYDSFQPQRPRSWAVAKLPLETESSRTRCDRRRGAAVSEALSLTVVEIHRDPSMSPRAAVGDSLVKPPSFASRPPVAMADAAREGG